MAQKVKSKRPKEKNGNLITRGYLSIIKFIQRNPKSSFFSVILIFLAIFVLVQEYNLFDPFYKNEKGEIIQNHWLNYIQIKFRNSNFQVFTGAFLSLLGAFITVLIYKRLDDRKAQSMEELLEQSYKVLKQSKKGDTILILSPTLFIGGSEHTKYHALYKNKLLEMIKENQNGSIEKYNFQFACNKFNFNLIEEYKSNGFSKLNTRNLNPEEKDELETNFIKWMKQHDSDVLINFHQQIYRKKYDGQDNKLNYMIDFFEFMKFIKEGKDKNAIEYIDLKNLGESNMLAVLNPNRPIATIATWEIQMPKPKGNLIDEQGAIDTLKKMIEFYIDTNKNGNP